MNKGNRLITGWVRFEDVHLFEPGADARYGARLLIDKRDRETAEQLRHAAMCGIEAPEEMNADALRTLFASVDRALAQLMRDGDAETRTARRAGESWRGCWVLEARCAHRPCVVNGALHILSEQGQFMNGCSGRASLRIDWREKDKRLVCGLLNVQKLDAREEEQADACAGTEDNMARTAPRDLYGTPRRAGRRRFVQRNTGNNAIFFR